MRRVARRALAKNGNSLTVSIPREFCEELKFYKGILLDVIRDDDNSVITIRRTPQQRDEPVEVAPARGVRVLHG